MRAVDIIARKRDGQALSDAEIHWFIENYTTDTLPDYQAAALLMAIIIRGMKTDEVTALTTAMAQSGDTLDLSAIGSYVVDKHSSGGVGDKTSLVVLPLVAASGVPVAKMSGRGLGYSGGTLDKLESISGFTSNLTEDQFIQQAQQIGLVLGGQSKDLAPADGKLYALRDVTGTVPSLPLIASSIMSKKIAAGADGIVLDVKVGSGAFMQTTDDGRELAQIMVNIGHGVGRDMVALISDMNQPLGHAVGNALEVREALDTLNGDGPVDFRTHCLEIAAYMLNLAGRGEKWTDVAAIKEELQARLTNGEALAMFRRMVEAQGGDVSMVDDPAHLPQAATQETITAATDGTISRADALDIAKAAFELGAGREKKTDVIDLAVGVVVHIKVGDQVKVGDPLATIHSNDDQKHATAKTHLDRGITISDDIAEPLPLFYDVIKLPASSNS